MEKNRELIKKFIPVLAQRTKDEEIEWSSCRCSKGTAAYEFKFKEHLLIISKGNKCFVLEFRTDRYDLIMDYGFNAYNPDAEPLKELYVLAKDSAEKKLNKVIDRILKELDSTEFIIINSEEEYWSEEENRFSAGALIWKTFSHKKEAEDYMKARKLVGRVISTNGYKPLDRRPQKVHAPSRTKVYLNLKKKWHQKWYKCPQCGFSEIRKSHKFCEGCGARIWK